MTGFRRKEGEQSTVSIMRIKHELSILVVLICYNVIYIINSKWKLWFSRWPVKCLTFAWELFVFMIGLSLNRQLLCHVSHSQHASHVRARVTVSQCDSVIGMYFKWLTVYVGFNILKKIFFVQLCLQCRMPGGWAESRGGLIFYKNTLQFRHTYLIF